MGTSFRVAPSTGLAAPHIRREVVKDGQQVRAKIGKARVLVDAGPPLHLPRTGAEPDVGPGIGQLGLEEVVHTCPPDLDLSIESLRGSELPIAGVVLDDGALVDLSADDSAELAHAPLEASAIVDQVQDRAESQSGRRADSEAPQPGPRVIPKPNAQAHAHDSAQKSEHEGKDLDDQDRKHGEIIALFQAHPAESESAPGSAS